MVSLCWRNWPSWLQALTRRLGSLSMWIIRLIASLSTAFLAFPCWIFLDLGGSCALFKIVSRHSVNLVLTAGSSEIRISQFSKTLHTKHFFVFSYTSELTSHYLIKYFEFSSYRLVFIVSKMEIYRIYLWGKWKFFRFIILSSFSICFSNSSLQYNNNEHWPWYNQKR